MTAISPDAQAVLDFWFGADGSPEHDALRPEWFRKDAAFDAQIAQRFGTLIETALAGGLADWANEPASALARIVVLDQFTRNVFRNTPRAFAGDPLALAAAQAMLARGQDRALRPVQRIFMALPFEHGEDLRLQAQSVQLFAALAAAEPVMAGNLDYAHRHQAVIARFGRFPHRNAVLGRASTAEELAFLQEPGSSF
ncbi:MAG: membrane protein [Methylibium sp. NZG]|nr:MAG: membrane protein [Methylibium sp. NZG]